MPGASYSYSCMFASIFTVVTQVMWARWAWPVLFFSPGLRRCAEAWPSRPSSTTSYWTSQSKNPSRPDADADEAKLHTLLTAAAAHPLAALNLLVNNESSRASLASIQGGSGFARRPLTLPFLSRRTYFDNIVAIDSLLEHIMVSVIPARLFPIVCVLVYLRIYCLCVEKNDICKYTNT